MTRGTRVRGGSRLTRSGWPVVCVLTSVLGIVNAGCSEASEQPPVAVSGPRDSLGLRSIRIPDLGDVNPPEITLRLIHTTTADPGLGHVAGAVFLSDSSLLVADRRSFEVIAFDRSGNVVERTGRWGDGPGEYKHLTRLGIGADGTPFVYDRLQRRFTFLDSRGRATRVQSVTRTGELMPLALLETGQFLSVYEPRPLLPPGVQRGPLILLLANYSSEDARDQRADSLGSWPGMERHVSLDGNEWNPVGFGATTLSAGRGAYTVVATNDPVDLTLYRGSATLLRIRGAASRRVVAARDKAAWIERFLSMYPEERRPAKRTVLERSGVREHYPAFGAVAVGGEGKIWIGGFAGPTERQRKWTVFDATGAPVGGLTLPVFRPEWNQYGRGGQRGREPVGREVTIPNASHELLDVGTGRLAVLRRVEFGDEFIEVYEVDIPRYPELRGDDVQGDAPTQWVTEPSPCGPHPSPAP